VVQIRLLTTDDVDIVYSRVENQLRRDSSTNALINPAIDEAIFKEWLSTSGALVAISTSNEIVGHIAGTEIDGEIWINGDGISFDSPEVLEALLSATEYPNKVINVWTFGDISSWEENGFHQVSHRGALIINAPAENEPELHFEIRRASPTDFHIAKEFDRILEDDQGGGSPSGVATSDEDIIEMLEDPEVHHYLAVGDEMFLGQAITFPVPQRRRSWPNTLHVSGVVTRPEFRNQGVATGIVRTALSNAYLNGFEYCEVNWRASNIRAGQFWSHFGFKRALTHLRRAPNSP